MKPSRALLARDGESRREYFRVQTHMPVRVTRVSGTEVQRWSQQIRAPRTEALALADPALAAWLQRLESKLDWILEHLGRESRPPLGAGDVRPVRISGSGIWCEVDEPLCEGERALVELLLPEKGGLAVRCLARVVVPEPTERAAALAFDVIREDDRDAIVRHAYEVQRGDLRLRSADEERG